MKKEAFNYHTVVAVQEVGGGYIILTIHASYGVDMESRIVLSGRADDFPVGSQFELRAIIYG